jgi:hypothetical protein
VRYRASCRAWEREFVEMPPDEDEVLPFIREAQRGRRGMSNARAPQLRGFASAGDLLG